MSTGALELRSIHLRVADLERSLAFYAGQVGFALKRRDADTAELATGEGGAGHLILSAAPAAAATGPEAAGLFHAALLFPDRRSLGAWLRTAAARGLAFDGAADHGVSEALYTRDPDGNGLEFYADRDAASWPRSHGELAMTTDPLDLSGLLKEGSGGEGDLGGCRWGHLHLRVTDLERSSAHYQRLLGLDVTQRSFPGARFLAADGYHHHLGLNTWGNPRRPHPRGRIGLVAACFVRPGLPPAEEATDPDGILVMLGGSA